MTKKEFFKKGDVNYMKKTLSLILAVLMIVATMPVALAAEPIVLTEANVVEWPTATGELWYGQKASEAVTVSGGIVTTDGTPNGTVIPGEFVIYDTPALPTYSASGYKLYLNFIPDDTSAYTGFEKLRNDACKVPIYKPTPVLVDEINDPIIATEVEAGAKLSTSILSGGQVKNPVVPTEPKALSSKWRWTSTSTIVDKSGWYEARMVIANYEILYKDVYVKIKGEGIETEMTKVPTFNLTYNGSSLWSDITFNDGIVVEKGTENVIEGAFSIVNTMNVTMSGIINAGVYENYKIKFTPANTDKYLPCEVTTTITVTKATPAWTTGEALVLNYDYGATPFGQYGDIIEGIDARNLNCYDEQYNPYNYTFMLYDEQGEALTFDRDFIPDAGTYNYNVKVSIAGYASALANWDTDTLLPVTIVIAPANAQIQDFSYSYVSGEIKGNYGNLYLNGTADITIGDNTIEDVAVTQGRFTATWKPADTKNDADYDVTVKYTAADGDNAVVESDHTGTISYKTDRNINLKSDKIGVRVPTATLRLKLIAIMPMVSRRRRPSPVWGNMNINMILTAG